MDTVILVLVLVTVVVPIALMWEKKRSAEIVRGWAERNGFTVHETEFRALKRGPFSLTTWNFQAVRRVVVSGQDGERKTGWVRCNAYLPANNVEVRWEEEQPQPQPRPYR